MWKESISLSLISTRNNYDYGRYSLLLGILEKNLSVVRSLNRLYFAKDASLKQAYEYFIASILRKPKEHRMIVKALAGKDAGCQEMRF